MQILRVLSLTLVLALGLHAVAQARDLVVICQNDNPAEEIQSFQPLVTYLGARLSEFGITGGRVIIESDMLQVGVRMRRQEADLFFESLYSTLLIKRDAGTVPWLRRWKGGDAEYHTAILVRKDAGIARLEDLSGRRLALTDPFSTSGYLMPMEALRKANLNVQNFIDDPKPLPARTVGYLFSDSRANSLAWLLYGKVDAIAMGSDNLKDINANAWGKIRVVHETPPVPRNIVSYRKEMDPKLLARIRELLLGLEHTEEGRQILHEMEKTKRIDDLPEGSLARFAPMVDFVRSKR